MLDGDLVEAYLRWPDTRADTDFWAHEQISELVFRQDGPTLWQTTLRLIEAVPRDRPDLLAVVASGPLEDLLGFAGDAYIDKVEELAVHDGWLARAVSGVWKNQLGDEVWHRVQQIAGRVAEPL